MRYRYLLTIHGRTSRLGFWRAYLAAAIVTTAFFAAGVAAAIHVGWWGAPLLLPIILGEWMVIAASIRRLHDRGRSGWWFVIFYGPVLAGGALTPVVTQSAPAMAPALALLILAGLGVAIWGWIEIGVLGSRPVDNAYGPVPSRGA